MRLFFFLLSLLLFAPSARAMEFLEDDYHPRTFDKFNKAEGKYDEYEIGDHYEWTLYGARYDKPNYGHRFEWTKPGLGAMSVCVELDGETGGKRWRGLADDAHCPKLETETKWDIPFEGAPSRCLRVDKLTHGLGFARIIDDRQCAKPATIYVWERKHASLPQYCMEVDGSSLGKIFRHEAPDYLCSKTLDSVVAFGREKPTPLRELPKAERKLASIVTPLELDPALRESPEELEDGVEHVHRSGDRIHHSVADEVTGGISLSTLRLRPNCLDTIYRTVQGYCGREAVHERHLENRTAAWAVQSTIQRNTPRRVILDSDVKVNGAVACSYRVVIEDKNLCSFRVSDRGRGSGSGSGD